MPLTDPSLAELAASYGIATEFWDWKGRLTEVTDETVIAVLAAMDVDGSTPERAREAVVAARDRFWRRSLPACVVMEQGEDAYVDVHVVAGRPADLTILLEEGGTRRPTQVDNWNPDRMIDGTLLGEATFRLPGDLPLGYHQLRLESEAAVTEGVLVVTPAVLGFPRSMGDRRIWGYAAQLYSVRSSESWGIGDLTDLGDLATWSATQQGAGYILINPLAAAQPVAPMEPSPYLPVSRRYVNPLYVRPEAIPEFATLKRSRRERIVVLRDGLLESLAEETHLQRDRAWEAKREALRTIQQAGMKRARRMAFEDFCRREGKALVDFATWCVLAEWHGNDWRSWPEELQDPRSTEVALFAAKQSGDITFHMWLQWIADTQLSQAQQAARDAGMRVGVVNDLAVGVHPSGADTWAMRGVFAEGVSVGAPPDPFNQAGQDWGQPPWRPDRLADLAYAPFRSMVAGILRHSGGIRVDHIIGLFRLWWVPAGGDPRAGTYVSYDHRALVGIITLEAYRAGALVIGEDLGTVEPGARDYLARRGVLGTSILWFETGDGRPLPPEAWRRYCMASVTTHDLPPTAGYLAGDHVRLRHRLGLLTESLEAELEASAREQEAWIDELERRGALAVGERDPEEIMLALHRFVTWTPSRVLCAALTDAVGDRLTQNQPGTVDEYPNWRVPLSGPDGEPVLLEDVFSSERAARVAAIMADATAVPGF